VNQVLDEIGINLNAQLVDAPANAMTAPQVVAQAGPQAEPAEAAGIDVDLQARLDNLRRS